ncbi:MAG: cyclase family protein [Nitrospira sp.]|nr:cyclase family protein [Nitrospira sp.]
MARRIVDLTLPIQEEMPTFPGGWHPAVQVTLLGRHEVENRETRRLVLGTHTGTHCDAPRHFIPGGDTVDRFSLHSLVGPALVVDFSKAQGGHEVDVADFERQLGDQRPERLIMRFDWSDHWSKEDYYNDYPFISRAAARWLVNRGVRLLAMDTPTPDNPANCRGSEMDSPNHKLLLGSGVILVESLCSLRQLRQQNVELIVLPLKLVGGDGSPVRCIAIESA